MNDVSFRIRQLLDELAPPETGKRSVVVVDDTWSKVVLFAFAAGAGLAEHHAPLPATIQIVQGEAELTVGDHAVSGKPGTWLRMEPETPHSILALTPVVMLLTLSK